MTLTAVPISSSFLYLATFLATLWLLGSAGEVVSPEMPCPHHPPSLMKPMWGARNGVKEAHAIQR